MFNMVTIRKAVPFTEQQYKWIKAQIKAGEFINDSEYIKNIVRQDQVNLYANFLITTKLNAMIMNYKEHNVQTDNIKYV